MAVVDSEFVQRTTPGTTTATTMQDTGCTSTALVNGVDYFVVGFANHQDDGGVAFVPTQWSEAELRFGTTRLAFSSAQTPFGNFAINGAACTQIHVAAMVTGDGSSTLNIRAQSGDGSICTYASLSWQIMALDELVVDVDYWVADSGSGDSSEVSGTDDDQAGARLRMVTDPSGSPSTQTIGTETEYFVTLSGIVGGFATDPAVYAPSFYAHDVRTLVGGTTYRIQWEYLDETSWEQGSALGQLTFTPSDSGDYAIWASAEAFVSGGVVQYRRSRVFALRLAAFVDYAYITNAGGIQCAANTVEGAAGLTYDFGSYEAYVAGCGTFQAGVNWGRSFMRHDGAPDVDYPEDDGTSYNFVVNGLTSTSDISALGFGVISSDAGSQTWRNVGESTSPGGVLAFGRNRGDTANSRSVLLAFALETAAPPPAAATSPVGFFDVQIVPVGWFDPTIQPIGWFDEQFIGLSTDVIVTPAADSMVFDDLSTTIALSALTRTPAAGSMVFDDLGATIAQTSNVSAAADQVVFDDLAATVTVSAVTRTPAADSCVFDDLAASVVLGAITVSTALDSVVFDDLAATISQASVLTPAASSTVFDDLGPTTSVSAIVVAAAVDTCMFDDLAATVIPGIVAIDPAADVFVFDDLAAAVVLAGTTLAPSPSSIIFDALTATVLHDIVVPVAASQIVFDDLSATVTMSDVVATPSTASMPFTSLSPSIVITNVIPASAGDTAFNDLSPTISVSNVSVAPFSDSMAFTSLAASVVQDSILSPAASQIEFEDRTATLTIGSVTATPGASSTVFDDLAASVVQDSTVVAAPVSAQVFDDQNPSTSVSSIAVDPDVDEVVFTSLPATPFQGVIQHPDASEMDFSSLVPSVLASAITVTAPISAFVCDALVASISTQTMVTAPASTMVMTSLSAVVEQAFVAQPAASSMVYNSLPATVDVGPPIPPPPPPPRPNPNVRSGRGGGGGGSPFFFQPPQQIPPPPISSEEDLQQEEIEQESGEDDAPYEAAVGLAELFSNAPHKAVVFGLSATFARPKRR